MTTKDEEKAMIGNLVAALPEGYVRSILTDFLPGINSAIDDDLGFVGWRETWDHLKEVRAEIDAISKQRDTVVADLRESSRLLDHVRAQLADVRSTADQIRRKISG